MRKYFILFSTALVVAACEPEQQPLLPGLPLNVASVRLQKSYRTNSETIIANGINALQLELIFLDETGLAVPVENHPIEIWVNKKEQLLPPYSFTTTKTGTFEFSMRTVDGRTFSENALKVSAVMAPELTSYRLPIVFHYFHVEQEPLALQEVQKIVSILTDTLVVVNQAFANARNSADPNAIDAHIEFYMASEDPEGNPLTYPGIEFIHAPGMTYEWDDMMANINDGHNWHPQQYINVWILYLNGASGIAFYPEYEQTPSGYPTGLYGTLLQRYVLEQSLVFVLTHEIGHMLDLRHVFGMDCLESDECSDTKAYRRNPNNIWGKEELIRRSCDYELFAATNYMDYVETEANTFTRNQVQRMHHALARSPFLPTPMNRNVAGRKGQPGSHKGMSVKMKDPVID